MKEIPCQICRGRREKIAELNRLKEQGGPFLREKRRTNLYSRDEERVIEKGYVEQLDECPECRRRGDTTAMNDIGANFEQTTHIHKCGKCGIKLPKDSETVFKGTYTSSDLGEGVNGEL
jgi:RecJ-like exonuclease